MPPEAPFSLGERARGGRKLMLTPLIDAIFILVFFFMLSTQFLKLSAMPVSLAAGGAGAGAPQIILSVEGDAYLLNGERVEEAALASSLMALYERGGEALLIRAGSETSIDDMARALSIARTVDGLNIRFGGN